MTPRILVPPGIGDGYWVLVKLRGWLESIGHPRARLWIHDAAPRRAGDMWARVPFVHFCGYAAVPRMHGGKPLPADRTALHQAYHTPNHVIQRDVCGFDYLISLNGALDAGLSLDAALPGPANWYERAYDEQVTAAHAASYRIQYGDYVVASFWDHGAYRKWLAEFPVEQIVAMLQAITDAGQRIIIIGAEWDSTGIGVRLTHHDRRFTNLIGETDYDALTGLLAGANAVVGFPAGSTLLGPYFRKPTVLLWHKHYARAMWTNAVSPDAISYRALDTATASAESVAAEVLSLIAGVRDAA